MYIHYAWNVLPILFACLQIGLAGISLLLISSVLCEKKHQAEEKSEVDEKKHEKRGIFEEGYGHGGDFGHSFEEDHHHVHHHHEKTIVDVKKVCWLFKLFLFSLILILRKTS